MLVWSWLIAAPALAWPAPFEESAPVVADSAPSSPVTAGAPAEATTPSDRPRTHAAGLRYRYLWLPRGVLNPWYYPSEETRLPRPDARGHTLGAELSLQPGPIHYTFYAEGWMVRLDEGYWDDVETPADHLDGDWIKPEGLGMLAVGANFGNEWPLTPQEQDVWLGLQFSGGLGLGVAWGEFKRWQPGLATVPPTECLPEATSDLRRAACEPDEVTKVPPVLPLVDISLGLAVHVMDRAYLRLEAGLHSLPYVGVSGGGQF